MATEILSIADYMIIGGLLLISCLIGLYFACKYNASISEYFIGDRKLGLFPVTMSLVASFMSTNTILGLPAEVYQVGTQFSIQIISIIIAVILAAEVFMPVYYNLKLTSVNEYLEHRFCSKFVKAAGTLGFFLATMPYMAVVLFGPSLALSSVTPLTIPTSVLLVGLTCTFYTAIGGIKAVIWSDVFQCILMFLGVLAIIIQGSIESKGIVNAWKIAEKGGRISFFNMKLDLYNHDTFWAVLFGTLITWCAIFCTMQTQVQRYCSMDSVLKARQTLYYNLPCLILYSSMAVLCGVVIYAKYETCDPVKFDHITRYDQLMPYFVMDTLSNLPGIPGLFVACAFSGSLSTLSSGFNSLAAITWEDVLKNVIRTKNEQQTLHITRALSLFYGLLAIAMAFIVERNGSVLQTSIMLSGSMMGPIFALFLLGLIFPFATSKGAISGLFSGIAISLWISVGSLIYPKTRAVLPTSIETCTEEIIVEYHNNSTEFISEFKDPEGFLKLYHIAYLFIPLIGFLITICIGLIGSLMMGTDKNKVDPALVSPIGRWLFPSFHHYSLTPNDERTKMNVKNKQIISGLSYKINSFKNSQSGESV